MKLTEVSIAESRTNVCGKLRVHPLAACVVLPLALADLSCGSAIAATLPVANCNDAGSGSLRAALALAHSGDSIDLTALTCGKISLATGSLNIEVDNLTLQGPSTNTLTIAGGQKVNHDYHVLYHSGYGTLRVNALRITDSLAAYAFPSHGSCVSSRGSLYLNRSTVTECSQGAITVRRDFTAHYSTISNSNPGVANGGSASINSSTISHNFGWECAGVRLGPSDGQPTTATVLISNSTISGNVAYRYAGGGGAGCIFAPTTISNSTIAFNRGDGDGGGGLVMRADITVQSSIIANNGGYSNYLNYQDNLRLLGGSTIHGSNNIILNFGADGIGINVDPQLLPLADNGGPTQTHALAVGSPAIDAGSNPSGLTTDQRGAPFARTVGAAPDIGAFESRPPAVYIDGTFTGSWFDPSQNGHGLMLEVLSDNRLLALWFAFNPQGTEQSWFGGVGTYNGDTAVITDVALPTGGSWIPNFDPSKIEREPWGRLIFTFTDHDHGRVAFDSRYGSGSMNLLRLTNVAEQSTLRPIGSPGAVTTDASGNVFFSSSPNSVFKLDRQGALKRIAGSGAAGYSGDGGAATQAQLNFPLSYPELEQDPYDYTPLIGGLAVDRTGNVYIADAYNNRVRRIDANGIITTVVGTGSANDDSGDGGPATNAAIHWPQGVAVDLTGNLYVTTAWGSLRKIKPDGVISSLAGNNCGQGYLGPGFCVPEQIAVDVASNVFVPDAYCRVRKVTQDGSVLTVAGADSVPSHGSAFTCGYAGDGGLATKAALQIPYAVAVDNAGNLYIADTFNNCIRRVNAAGIITTVAGVCKQAGFSGDGGPATSALLNQPYGVAVDNAGNFLIADTDNRRIRRVSADGNITTVAGNGTEVAPQTGNSVWVPTGKLLTARSRHTATLLQNGKVLVVGGLSGLGTPDLHYLDSAELYDPATGTWSATGHLSSPRSDHTATLLPNGKVLIAGGASSISTPAVDAVSVCELYDPATGTWTSTGNLGAARSTHTATLLQSGKVLVSGGWGGSDTLGSAELYDPATGIWSFTGNLNVPRYWHTATLLQNGKVLVAAGTNSGDLEYVLNDAELYDPITGVWSNTGSLISGRVLFTATPLQNGMVLVSGGYLPLPATTVSTAELYDPVTGKWRATGGLNTARESHTATLLANGHVLIAGGGHYSGAYPHLTYTEFDSSELYDADRATWVSADKLYVAREGHTATLLANGQILIAGGLVQGLSYPGVTLDTAELYAPPASIDASFTGSWFDPAQSGHGLMLEVLPDNRLLALWFAFNPAGNQQSWFGGVGTYSGNTATITDVALPSGGSWIPNFDPAKIVRNPWGTLKFTFTDCDHGKVDFVSTDGYGSGSMNLLRLTMPEGMSCP